jgi:hypothetical protein
MADTDTTEPLIPTPPVALVAAGIDADAVRDRLRLAVAEAGSLRSWSARNRVSPSVVSEVLQGRREPARTVLAALGLRRAPHAYRVAGLDEVRA